MPGKPGSIHEVKLMAESQTKMQGPVQPAVWRFPWTRGLLTIYYGLNSAHQCSILQQVSLASDGVSLSGYSQSQDEKHEVGFHLPPQATFLDTHTHTHTHTHKHTNTHLQHQFLFVFLPLGSLNLGGSKSLPTVYMHAISRMTEKGFPGGTVVKNLPANAGDTGSSPSPGRSHMPRSN